MQACRTIMFFLAEFAESVVFLDTRTGGVSWFAAAGYGTFVRAPQELDGCDTRPGFAACLAGCLAEEEAQCSGDEA
ncbi:Uncharacterised protein [Kingella potus]|uniref:Uncharacterized protein n=3 Tax=Kingella potus TaxID=265175 RepID=A0A377R1N5_9NEIS|nr:Uncharacterised protein [Kingella potus]